MRKLILVLLLSGLCGAADDKEDFDAFFYVFCTDTAAQKQRVKFPLRKTTLLDSGHEKYDTTVFSAKNWKHQSFFVDYGLAYHSQIYDNFDLELRDSDERVFAWHGVESGVQVYYYFKRISGKWFLIDWKNLSAKTAQGIP